MCIYIYIYIYIHIHIYIYIYTHICMYHAVQAVAGGRGYRRPPSTHPSSTVALPPSLLNTDRPSVLEDSMRDKSCVLFCVYAW